MKPDSIRQKFILAFGLWMLLYSAIPAQTSLVGKITYFSSGAKPAVGVSVSARGANAQTSNNTGEFELYFPNKQQGDKVRITIGDQDRYGAKLELVNDKTLEQIHLPSRPDEDILEIIVCKAGQRKEAALAYYNLMHLAMDINVSAKLNAIDKKLDRREQDLDNIRALEAEKLDLQRQMCQVEKKLQENAAFLANINTDVAQTMVSEALKVLNTDSNIRLAAKQLDTQKLDTLFLQAFEQEQNAQKHIKQIKEALQLKIILLEPLFDVKGIMECCVRLDDINRKMGYELDSDIRCNSWAVVYESLQDDDARNVKGNQHEFTGKNSAFEKLRIKLRQFRKKARKCP